MPSNVGPLGARRRCGRRSPVGTGWMPDIGSRLLDLICATTVGYRSRKRREQVATVSFPDCWSGVANGACQDSVLPLSQIGALPGQIRLRSAAECGDAGRPTGNAMSARPEEALQPCRWLACSRSVRSTGGPVVQVACGDPAGHYASACGRRNRLPTPPVG